MKDNYKSTVLEENVKKSRNQMGQNMNIAFKRMRFPVIDGIQTKVTLKSNVTGTFMNIGFMKDVDNTLNGNIADALLNSYSDIFRLIKVAGKTVSEGTNESNRSVLKKELIEELKEEFEMKPRKTGGKRDRVAETQITNNEYPSDIKKDSIFTNDKETKAEPKIETEKTKKE